MPTHTIHLPYERPPLTENQRLHHMVRAKLVREVRDVVFIAARAAGLPKGLGHLTVQLTYIPPDNRRRDEDNIVPTLKAACDALADGTKRHPGYGMVTDDTPDYMTKPMPIIAPADKTRAWNERLLLTLTWADREVTGDE